mgnify:CR=1 FL=1|jgi:Ser-tRNA(Ala) deacylase AlaX
MDDELKPSIKIALAINKINPDAKFDFNGDDIDTIEINWIDETTPISKEDIKNTIPIIEQELADRKTDATSGKQKLKDLGLTDAEIKALTGA